MRSPSPTSPSARAASARPHHRRSLTAKQILKVHRLELDLIKKTMAIMDRIDPNWKTKSFILRTPERSDSEEEGDPNAMSYAVIMAIQELIGHSNNNGIPINVNYKEQISDLNNRKAEVTKISTIVDMLYELDPTWTTTTPQTLSIIKEELKYSGFGLPWH